MNVEFINIRGCGYRPEGHKPCGAPSAYLVVLRMGMQHQYSWSCEKHAKQMAKEWHIELTRKDYLSKEESEARIADMEKEELQTIKLEDLIKQAQKGENNNG